MRDSYDFAPLETGRIPAGELKPMADEVELAGEPNPWHPWAEEPTQAGHCIRSERLGWGALGLQALKPGRRKCQGAGNIRALGPE